MNADSGDLRKMLHTGLQYVIPAFQRYYVWELKDWQRLWDDITDLLEPDAPSEHFMGSLVCVPGEHEPGRVPDYIVIDGQQRLTTFAILLSAIRDLAIAEGRDEIAGEISDGFLTQPHRKGLEHYRVVLRTRDRQTLFDLLDGKEPDKATRIGEAYRFFKKEIQRRMDDVPDTVPALFTTVTSRMPLVMITLSEENPFNIFETLNGTGQDLKQSDMIRNFVFMNTPLNEQDEYDEKKWGPMEDSLAAADGRPAIPLTDFYRDYLMRDGQYVPKNEVYVAFRREYEQDAPTPSQLASDLTRHALLYRSILRSEEAADKDVRKWLSYLSPLRIGTAYPLVLHLLEGHHDGSLSTDELCRCLRALQSFALRRSVVGESTRRYGRIFPAAIKELRPGETLASLVEYLVGEGWPDDKKFLSDFLKFPLYRRERFITRLVLRALEEDMGHKEPVDVETLLAQNKLQIEHVMPQSINDDADGEAWKAMLGDDWVTVHETYLHTIGNLTLTGYNPELSNHAYPRKKEEFANSHIELNRFFTDWDVWNLDAILKRGESLATTVAKIWPAASSFGK